MNVTSHKSQPRESVVNEGEQNSLPGIPNITDMAPSTKNEQGIEKWCDMINCVCPKALIKLEQFLLSSLWCDAKKKKLSPQQLLHQCNWEVWNMEVQHHLKITHQITCISSGKWTRNDHLLEIYSPDTKKMGGGDRRESIKEHPTTSHYFFSPQRWPHWV